MTTNDSGEIFVASISYPEQPLRISSTMNGNGLMVSYLNTDFNMTPEAYKRIGFHI